MKWTPLYMPICPYVHMEQLGSRWTDFFEILCLIILWKSIKQIQV
jgi:hypothetical protein